MKIKELKMNDKELLTVKELAKKLNVKPATVRVWARKNKIPYFRAGSGSYRFDLETVLARKISKANKK